MSRRNIRRYLPAFHRNARPGIRCGTCTRSAAHRKIRRIPTMRWRRHSRVDFGRACLISSRSSLPRSSSARVPGATPTLLAPTWTVRHFAPRSAASPAAMMAARLSTEQGATIMREKTPTRRWLQLAGLALVLSIAATLQAAAQSWPTKSITLVVPFPAGPALDLVARLVGNKLGETLGATVVVENRSGANGTLGSNVVARAAPDG